MDMMTIIVLLFGAVVVLISIGVILNHVKNQKKETETVDENKAELSKMTWSDLTEKVEQPAPSLETEESKAVEKPTEDVENLSLSEEVTPETEEPSFELEESKEDLFASPEEVSSETEEPKDDTFDSAVVPEENDNTLSTEKEEEPEEEKEEIEEAPISKLDDEEIVETEE